MKAIAIVSRPLLAYFTYGRWPALKITVRAGDQVLPSADVDIDGLKLPPRQNR